MCILISYHYIRQKGLLLLAEKLAQKQVPLLLDSGAFSAHHSGNEINFSEYKTFCKGEGRFFDLKISLDKIGDKKVSKANLDDMLSEGLDVMPVFTIDESEDDDNIDWFLKRGKRICIAGNPKVQGFEIGNARTYKQARLNYESRMERIFRRAEGNVWLHGLSFTNGVMPWRSRASSIDSSSWVSSGRYGFIHYFDEVKGAKIIPWKMLAKKGREAMANHRYSSYLSRCGLSWKDVVAYEETSPYTIRDMLSCAAWLNYAKACNHRNIEMYMAIAATTTIAPMAAASIFLRGDGTVDAKRAMDYLKELKEIRKDSDKFTTKIADGLAVCMSQKKRIPMWEKTK